MPGWSPRSRNAHSKQYGPRRILERSHLAEWIHDHFEAVYTCPTSYHLLLHMADLTLIHPDKNTIIVVCDNAAWHTSTQLRRNLKQIRNLERIHLINLPPYSSDHNPIEHVWEEAQDNISNYQRSTFTNTRQAFETFIHTNTFPYHLTK